MSRTRPGHPTTNARRPRTFLFPVAILAVLFWRSASAGIVPVCSLTIQNQLGFEHTAVTKFNIGETLVFRVKTRGRADWVMLFFRLPGIKEFQARPMRNTGENAYAFDFDTSTLAGPEFEYYIETQKGDQKLFLPPGAPEATIRASGGGAELPPVLPEILPPSSTAESILQFPLSANGSLQGDLEGVPAGSNLKNPNTSGNVRVVYTPQLKNGWGANVDSNFSFTNSALPAATAVDLTNMVVGVTQGCHALRAGDINVNESELTAFGLGRRGVEYGFDDQKAYVHAFDISSQQVKGFQGIGIPAARTSIFGAAAGYRFWQDAISVKAVFLTGNDDPSQGANVGVSPLYTARKGNVVSFLPEVKLFQQRLKLKAEMARSSYDGDLQDEAPAKSGRALSLGANLSLGRWTVGGGFRHIGKDFNSIGLAYITNDRVIYDTMVGFSKGAVNIQGTYQFQRDNVAGDASLATTRGQDGNILLSVSLSSAISANLGFHHVFQSAYQGEVKTPGTDSTSNTLTGGVNVMFGPNASINLAVTNSDLTSESAFINNTSAFNINLGGAFRAGEWLILNPTVGLALQKNKSTSEKNTTWTSMLNAEVFLVPQFFSAVAVSSFSRTELAGFVSQDLDLLGGIQVYLGKLLKVGNVVLAGKARHHVTDTAGVAVSDTRFLVQTDFAF